MRYWSQLLTALYPAEWRARYGPEFDALLEDAELGWRDLLDILKEALTMQLTSNNSWKAVSATAVLGGLLAFPIAHLSPARYTSQAQLRLTPLEATPPDRMRAAVDRMSEEALTRASLTAIVQKPSLDLYRDERRRMPMEDVVAQMRHDLQISQATAADGRSAEIAVGFTYPDRYKSQAAIHELVRLLIDWNATASFSGAIGFQENLEVSKPADLPAAPVPVSVWPLALRGLLAGLLAGALAVLASRWRLPRVLKFAGFAATGFLVALCLSFLIPNRFTSTAVVRPVTSAAFREKVLSSDFLSGVISATGLYPDEHMGTVEQLRRDLEVLPLYRSRVPSTYRISFTYSRDRYKAQQAVRRIIDELEMPPSKVFEVHSPNTLPPLPLRVLDAASLPERPVSPNRAVLALAGALAGALAWALSGLVPVGASAG